MSELFSFLPVGAVLPYAGEDPTALEGAGWLPCDGRLLRQADQPELFASLGTYWGGGEATFALPDLRGQFLRTCTDSDERDPDLALRQPLGSGTPEDVGSRQTYGTAPPQEDFTATIDNLGRDCTTYIDGCMDRPASCNSGTTTAAVSSGGDRETRPMNKYIWFIIKSHGLADNQPVEVPIGGLAAFAGVDADGFDNHWLRCDGVNFAPRGVFLRLFEAIGYAHGKQLEDESENFVLPDYRDYFLRGVTGVTGTDPDADKREEPYTGPGGEASGNSGNRVGSKQGWATAMPVKADLTTSYTKQPAADAEKSTNGTDRTFYTYQSNTSIQDVTQDGGDAESRPANVRVDWYIRYL